MPEKNSNISYVVDTSVLVDYIDIIPDVDSLHKETIGSTIDFTGSRVVITNTVTQELLKFKDDEGDTHRKRAAKELLNRISKLFNAPPPSMEEIYNIKESAEVEYDGVRFVLFPVHKDFTKSLPYEPEYKHRDGEILVAALAVACLTNGLKADGSEKIETVMKLRIRNVFLVTNDTQFMSFAWSHGIKPLAYHYEYSEPYSGIRKVTVPKDLLLAFWASKKLTLSEWRYYMPNESPLVSNEFLIMSLENPSDYPRDYRESEYSNVGRFDPWQRCIVPLKHVRNFPIRPKSVYQAMYLEALLEPKILGVICTGPAGSGKTFLALTAGIALKMSKAIKTICVIPCKEEESFGYLPGDLDNKLSPYVEAFKDAIRALINNGGLDSLRKSEIVAPEPADWQYQRDNTRRKKKRNQRTKNDSPNKAKVSEDKLQELSELTWKNYFIVMAVKFALGRTINDSLVFYDEFQLQNVNTARLLINRVGANSKLVITGDLGQIDPIYSNVWDNGITYACRGFYDSKYVARLYLVEDDINRSPLVKEIAKRLKPKK